MKTFSQLIKFIFLAVKIPANWGTQLDKESIIALYNLEKERNARLKSEGITQKMLDDFAEKNGY